jgi:hypothetical protein
MGDITRTMCSQRSRRPVKNYTVFAILISVLLVGCAGLHPNDSGVGFVLKSTDFADPCTDNPGDYPVIYDNFSSNDVDVSFKIVNTGNSNVFVVGTGFVIPPVGPSQRPRIIRMTVDSGGAIRLRGQGDDCAWTAIVWPH